LSCMGPTLSRFSTAPMLLDAWYKRSSDLLRPSHSFVIALALSTSALPPKSTSEIPVRASKFAHPSKKFPDISLREFGWKVRFHWHKRERVGAYQGLNTQNSLFFSLLAGNLVAETGSTVTASATTHSGIVGCFPVSGYGRRLGGIQPLAFRIRRWPHEFTLLWMIGSLRSLFER
jgi:hypothetical protein